jgi:hypothetical protein
VRNLQNLRNLAIVMALAFVVAFAPNGGNAAEVVLTLITMAFLTAIAWTLYILGRQNQLTLATLSDGRRAVLYGAFGLIALLIAGSDELFASGGGTLAWLLLFAASVSAIYLVWKEANTYS